MTEHDFNSLYDQYPIVIEQMEDKFTSHEFILKLAQQNQTQYIEALYAYRFSEHRESIAPFRALHGILAKKLYSFPELITLVRKDAPSVDIFGRPGDCAEWKKIS